MGTIPLLGEEAPGIYQVCTVANTDYRIEVPFRATGLVIWFETSAADDTMLGGRIAFGDTDDEVASIANTDTKLGYHPALPVEYELTTRGSYASLRQDGFVHVACPTALAVARGYWLFNANI